MLLVWKVLWLLMLKIRTLNDWQSFLRNYSSFLFYTQLLGQLTMGLKSISVTFHCSLFSKKGAGSFTLNFRGYGTVTTAEFWRKFTFLALILPFALPLMSTLTGSKRLFGDRTSTTYEPAGTLFTVKLPSVLRKPM